MNVLNFREGRTRVIFNLPIEDENEERAVSDIIDYLQSQRISQLGLRGFTHSILKNAVFCGYWWSDDTQQWIKDRIVLFIIDYLFDVDDHVLIQHLRELKRIVSEAYRLYGSMQEEIWLVSHKVLRYTS